MPDIHPQWLIEFTHDYEDGNRVAKRGLNATPMVARKFAIGLGEVMAFSSWQGRHRAITVFHFHPDFPDEERHAYMESHDEGHRILVGVIAQIEAEGSRPWLALADRWVLAARRAGRGVGVWAHGLGAVAAAFLAGAMR